jgi:hypothetical protein
MQNWRDTLISQYAQSPALLSLIDSFNQAVDPVANLNDFHRLIWNVATAVGYGLDVWGRIVGVGRVLNISGGTKFFGFDEATNVHAKPFNTAPFYSGQLINQNFALSDDGFRVLIYAKAFANICDGSIAAINQILLTLFPGRGNCYVRDNLNMTMTYVFNFVLTPVESAIVSESGILPRPAGVFATVTVVP